jgi:nicotinamide mononucleotide transporter
MKILNEFLHYVKLDVMQLIVLVLGVTEVLLARVNNVWLYPAGIGAVILSMYSLFYAKLYAECILQAYYLVMSIYGWKCWTTKRGESTISITDTTPKEWFITIGIVAFAWLTLFKFLTMFTDSEHPVWDAWVSATAWAGMWLLARRKVENWILLNISNAFAIPLLILKGLTLFALLTIILFIVACFGYVDWSKAATKQAQYHEI